MTSKSLRKTWFVKLAKKRCVCVCYNIYLKGAKLHKLHLYVFSVNALGKGDQGFEVERNLSKVWSN